MLVQEIIDDPANFYDLVRLYASGLFSLSRADIRALQFSISYRSLADIWNFGAYYRR